MSFLKWLDKNFELVCLAALLIMMTVFSFTNVIMRYFFQDALSWSDEACCYCLAISAFFCLPCSIRHRSAIRVDVLSTLLPEGLQKTVSLICNLIMIVFLVLCVKGGLDIAANAAMVHQKSPALQIPVAYFYDLMTLGLALAIFRSVQTIVLDLMNKKEEAK